MRRATQNCRFFSELREPKANALHLPAPVRNDCVKWEREPYHGWCLAAGVGDFIDPRPNGGTKWILTVALGKLRG